MNLSKTFWTIMLIFFIIYISIFISSKSGYYEYSNKNKKQLTEAKIKLFEKDVKEGKKIDVKNYFKNKDVNYDNKVTVIGNKVSSIINSGISKGLEGGFKIMEKIIE